MIPEGVTLPDKLGQGTRTSQDDDDDIIML